MENPTSEREETHTKEGAKATPPHNEVSHVPNPQYHYPGLMVPYVEGPKMDWTITCPPFPICAMENHVRTFLTVSFQYFKRVLNTRK